HSAQFAKVQTVLPATDEREAARENQPGKIIDISSYRQTRSKNGNATPLRAKLLPIVRRYMVHYEEQSKTEEYRRFETSSSFKAVQCALALRDKETAERLVQGVKGEHEDQV